mmetsp:Transcript_12563/g.38402  ORF Transcript_12563/g.38402 Transcript_12563/m.38402 type:complete len:210 (-) Transcript_12563:168-797(-)
MGITHRSMCRHPKRPSQATIRTEDIFRSRRRNSSQTTWLACMIWPRIMIITPKNCSCWLLGFFSAYTFAIPTSIMPVTLIVIPAQLNLSSLRLRKMIDRSAVKMSCAPRSIWYTDTEVYNSPVVPHPVASKSNMVGQLMRAISFQDASCSFSSCAPSRSFFFSSSFPECADVLGLSKMMQIDIPTNIENTWNHGFSKRSSFEYRPGPCA